MARAPSVAIVVGSLVALGVCVALLVSSLRERPRLPPPDSRAAPPPAAPQPAAPPTAVPAASPANAAPEPAPPSAPPPWNEVPVAARLSDLGPFARPVYDGLQRARAELEGCFAAAAREDAGRQRAPAQPDEDSWGAAVVYLDLESRAGELVVVAAPLQNLGDSSLELVDCCERTLRGFRIAAPGAEPGRRFRLAFQLTQ